MSARAERRAMVALVAVFALLVQALVPALAMAAPAAGSGLQICAQADPQAPPHDPGLPAADHACKHCLCPAPASTPPPVAEARPIAYAVAATPAAGGPRALKPPARAPPRPPGQGPPPSDA